MLLQAGVLLADLLFQWFLVVLFLLEAGAKVILNWEHQLSITRDHELYNEISQDQRGTALTIAGLVFAGIALLLSNSPGRFVTQVEVFVVAFGFLLVAVFAHELTLTYRVVLTIQEMALEYGILLLVFGLLLLVNELVPEATLVMVIVFVIVLLFRLYSVKGELEGHYHEGRTEDGRDG